MKVFLEALLGLLLVQANLVFSWFKPKYATPGQFPHQVSLVWIGPPEIPHFHSCGGAILSELWVISSGFCLSDIPNTNRILVKAGSHNITHDDEHVQKVEVSKLIVHEKYNRNQAMKSLAPYDLGLLKLKVALIFNNRVKLIKLPAADGIISKTEINYNLALAGWGISSLGTIKKQDEILRTVNLPIVSNKICTDSIKKDYNWVELDDSQICTRPLDGNESACIGDFGGPLVQYDNTNTAELVGIVSWSMMPCNTVGIPPVYARIPYFVKWIKKKMKDE